jgi:alkanesulfonate monooxygenase SsuD/methylene tetrahydromethanopterin reductase-like flavin-dependent oxidoreductase (luciferase family)
MFDQLRYHMRPLQQPHPPLAIAGLSPNSETLLLAGEYGLIPLSIAFSTGHLRSHWDAVMKGAQKTGKAPSRAMWRINTPVVVADTDQEAFDLAVNGPTGRCFREYLLPLWTAAGLLPAFKEDPAMADSDVTVEYMARESWLVGSPETVRKKIAALQEKTGGFGCVLATVFDHLEDEAPWFRSLKLMAEKVLPAFVNVWNDEKIPVQAAE